MCTVCCVLQAVCCVRCAVCYAMCADRVPRGAAHTIQGILPYYFGTIAPKHWWKRIDHCVYPSSWS